MKNLYDEGFSSELTNMIRKIYQLIIIHEIIMHYRENLYG